VAADTSLNTEVEFLADQVTPAQARGPDQVTGERQTRRYILASHIAPSEDDADFTRMPWATGL
jgi:hypothetical protein